MPARIKRTGKANSIPGGLAIAAFVSMILTFVLSAAIAFSINIEKITWIQAGYWIMVMLFLSSFVGGKCAFASVKRQRIAISIMSGVLYWGLLLCITALFFGGNFSAVWQTAGIIGAGSGTAALISVPYGKKKSKKPGRSYC